jgi:DDE superfamily endonuclease
LQHVIHIYNILPKDSYNVDEKGFMMGMASKCKVICQRSRRNPKLTQSGNRESVTVIESVSGDGIALPPMVINKGKAHYVGWYAGITEEDVATFGCSPKGWTDNCLGVEWLKQNFEKYTAPR